METLKINKHTDREKKKNIQSYKTSLEIENTETGEKKVLKILKIKKNNNYLVSVPKLKLNDTKERKITKAKLNKLFNNETIIYKGYDKTKKEYIQYNIKLKSQYINPNNIDVRFLNTDDIKLKINLEFSEKLTFHIIDIPQPIGENNNIWTFKGTEANLQNYLDNYISQYLTNNYEILNNILSLELAQPIKLIDNNNFIINFTFTDNINNYAIEKKRNYAKLKNIFNEDIECINNPPNKNCLIYYFEELYNKGGHKAIYKKIYQELQQILDNSENNTVYLDDLKKVLNENDISIIINSCHGVIYKKENEKYSKINKLKLLNIYLEDNHIYIINDSKKNKELTRRKTTNYEGKDIKFKQKITDLEFLEKQIISYFSNLETGEKKIMLNDEKKIISNNENIIKLEPLFKKFNVDVKHIFKGSHTFINKIFNERNINNYSIFPFKIPDSSLKYTNYTNENFNTKDAVYLDKNRAFSCALYELEFIPTFNILHNEYRNYKEDEPIIKSWLYFITTKEPNEYYYNGFFFGWYLLKYGYDNKINIINVFECDVIKDDKDNIINPYIGIIDELFKSAENEEQKKYIKEGINCYIGQFLRPEPSEINYFNKYKIMTENDIKLYKSKEVLDKFTELEKNSLAIDGINKTDQEILKNFTIEDNINILSTVDSNLKIDHLQNKLYFTSQKQKMKNWNSGKDNKILNIAIQNKTRSYLLDMMHKLSINLKDIIEINTDSIYFLKNNINLDIIKNEINDKITGWKVINDNKKTQNFMFNNSSFELIEEPYFFSNNNNKYYFNLQFAGGGKTYNIKKTIDEEITKNKNYSYIILSSYNDFLTFYRKQNYNNNTIAHYIYNPEKIKEITEKNIYVDEAGITNINEYLFLFRHINKNFYFFGDNQQLKPVKSFNLSDKFINKIATNINTSWTNKRNTFTKDKYIKLIEKGEDEKYIKKQLEKYNTPWEFADILIAYENETVNKYNKKVLEFHKKEFNKNNISLNIPIINCNNGVKVINKETLTEEIIFNRHSFNIIEKFDNKYIINDTVNNYLIDKESLINNFKVGYCITLYASQGKTFNSFFFCPEDVRHLKKKGALYTLISRLHFKDKNDIKNKYYTENCETLKKNISNISMFKNIIIKKK